MATFVVDTSVIVQWFDSNDELHFIKARKIFQDLQDGKINILIPSSLPLELLNALLIGKKCTLEYADLAIRELFKTTITMVEINLPVLEKTARLMEKYSLTAYDAYFWALAQYEDCQLISDDQKAHGKVTDGTVVMLKDYPISRKLFQKVI